MKHHQNEIEGTGRPAVQPPYDHANPAEAMINRKSSTRGSGFKPFIAMLDNNLWLLSGITLGITALIICWWILSGQGPGGTHLFNNDQETKAPQTSQQNDTAVNQAIEQLEDQLTGLIDRMEMLTDSITYLESKLIRAHVLADSIITAEQHASSLSPKQPVNSRSMRAVDALPPSAAGQTARQAPAGVTTAPRETTASSATVAATEKSTTRLPDNVLQGALTPPADAMPGKQPNSSVKTTQDTVRTAATKESRAPAPKHPIPVNMPENALWVINLTSSPSQTDANRFAAKARSRGIETQQQQVTVKGKRYWRVQTTGFSTVDEAHSYAGIVKEKLGLGDVWITRR